MILEETTQGRTIAVIKKTDSNKVRQDILFYSKTLFPIKEFEESLYDPIGIMAPTGMMGNIYHEKPLGDILVRILKSKTVIPPLELTAAKAQSSGRQAIAPTRSPTNAPPSASP